MSDANKPASPSVNMPGDNNWLRQLDWREFERLVANSYRAHGFEVTTTAPGADGGIDLVLARGAERYLVQCKHWRTSMVGAPVIRELYGLVVAHQAAGGIVVTSGTFSQEAYDFARRVGIQLLGGPATLELVAAGRLPDNSLLGGTGPAAASTVGASGGPPRCPVCASPMVVKRARKGAHKGESFWACPRFPSCRGTAPYQRPVGYAHAQPTSPDYASWPTTFAPAVPPRQAQPGRSAGRRREVRVGAVLLGVFLPLLAMWVGVQLLMAMVANPRTTERSAPRAIPTYPVTVPSPSTEPGTIRVGEQPMAIAVDSAAGRAYTANYVSGDVSVIDLDRQMVVDSLDVDGSPSAVAVDPKAGVLWVADYDGARVRAIDLKSGKQVAKLKVAARPQALAIDSGRSRLYVTSKDSDDISVFNTDTRKRVQTIAGNSPGALAIDTKERILYVGRTTNGFIYSYDLRDREWGKHWFVALEPVALAVDSERHRVYAASSRSLREFNMVTDKSRRLDTPPDVIGVAVDPERRVAHVVNPETHTVEVLSTK